MKKYLLFFVLFASIATVAQATLIVNNTSYSFAATGSGNWPGSGLFDLDGDGVNDIELLPSVSYTSTTVTLQSFGNAQLSNVFALVSYGQEVGAQTTYLSGGQHVMGNVITGDNCMIAPPPGCYQPVYPNVSTNYIGIKFYINGEIHYGWIEWLLSTNVPGHPNENWRGITKIVYDDEANKSVTVGTIVTSTVNTSNESFTIYPNPVKDQLYIVNDLHIDVIEVYNTTGQPVYNEDNFNNAILSIPMQTWPKGIYYVVMKSADKMERKRIAKE
jgi:hypothetical protein